MVDGLAGIGVPKGGADPQSAATAEDLQALCAGYKIVIAKLTGRSFPSEPREQLELAIRAALRRWSEPDATADRGTKHVRANGMRRVP